LLHFFKKKEAINSVVYNNDILNVIKEITNKLQKKILKEDSAMA